MAIAFTLPIIIGIVFAYIFPFQSISMSSLSGALLFALLVSNFLACDWHEFFKQRLSQNKKSLILSIAANLFFIYILSPFVLLGLAKLWISDESMLRGLVYCFLAPPALVAPFFCERRGGNSTISMETVFIATLLCPLITPLMCQVLLGSKVYVNYLYLSEFLILTLTIPLFLVFFLQKTAFYKRQKIQRALPYLNSGLLSLLVFVLFGSLIKNSHFNTLSWDVLSVVLLFLFLMDFGSYFFLKYILKNWKERKSLDLETLPITLSMRNFAIPASTLLFFDSRATLPAMLGFLVHTLFFACLLRKKNVA